MRSQYSLLANLAVCTQHWQFFKNPNATWWYSRSDIGAGQPPTPTLRDRSSVDSLDTCPETEFQG
jgi:hypothetical protein